MYRLLDSHLPGTIETIRRFRRTFGQGLEDLTFPNTMEEYMAESLERYKDDPLLPELIVKDNQMEEALAEYRERRKLNQTLALDQWLLSSTR